jgi:elongation factor P--(R)-beta-lysine ligase
MNLESAMNEQERLQSLKPNLERRAAILQYIRDFFTGQGFLEVETPVRVPVVAPEINILPVASEGWYLLTSPELHMKRLVAAGYPKLFQLCRCFRKNERGKLHNPEFTMLEWYRASGDYLSVISDTENLVDYIAQKFQTGPVLEYRNQKFELAQPWPRVTVRDAYLNSAGWDPVADPDPLRFDTDMCDKVIPAFSKTRPTVITDYPAPFASLSRLKEEDPRVAERAEVFFGGLEIANGYSELIDPAEQEKRFSAEIRLIREQRGQDAQMPRQFLDAMKFMPECGGIALGVDRLVMLFCNAPAIDDVMPFTADTV